MCLRLEEAVPSAKQWVSQSARSAHHSVNYVFFKFIMGLILQTGPFIATFLRSPAPVVMAALCLVFLPQ